MSNDLPPAIEGEKLRAASHDHSRRILVVDDDAEAAAAIVSALQHLGHGAVSCANAQEALALIPTGNFDLLLVDYRMPEMTGLDLIAMLRQDDCQLPVIMMTGHFATDDRVPAEPMGITTILHKPITLPQLAQALDEPRVAAGVHPA